ncbi:S66 peptidase family protein [Luteibaculum oceani]|uniref:LD-carboxypeptidase n=1 Tax=Luteibaculum oceani TaxID=1294296 RepID=A0A5C6VKD7_9FLAO|nr:LD-carboxypeptidase [Luteibaculum oceani]TXC85094.1 LD-carboxypeptidase [Luteibaculum oceani]
MSHTPTIALVATARFAEESFCIPAIQRLNEMGCNVVLPPNFYASDNQFGGSDEIRFKNFRWAWDQTDVDAIWIVRGGYGSIRIAQEIKQLIRNKPNDKVLIGYSDVTALHGLFQRCGFYSIHGTMPVNFGTNTPESLERIVDFLKGNKLPGLSATRNQFNSPGVASGHLVGGNLSMLYSMQNTPYMPELNGAILFIEDLDEYLYHIDRMMQNLKHSGALDKIAGLVVGQLSDMNDNTVPFGKNANEIVFDYTKNLGIPVAFNFPFGHCENNLPLIHGAQVNLRVSSKESAILEYVG